MEKHVRNDICVDNKKITLNPIPTEIGFSSEYISIQSLLTNTNTKANKNTENIWIEDITIKIKDSKLTKMQEKYNFSYFSKLTIELIYDRETDIYKMDYHLMDLNNENGVYTIIIDLDKLWNLKKERLYVVMILSDDQTSFISTQMFNITNNLHKEVLFAEIFVDYDELMDSDNSSCEVIDFFTRTKVTANIDTY